MIETDKCCGTCRHHYHDNTMLKGDYVCVNTESEYLSDYTLYDDSCEDWEDRSKRL